MTGGRAVILGPTGRNFASGMSGGIAYVWDTEDKFNAHCNMDMVDLEELVEAEDIAEVKQLIEKHLNYTGSVVASNILSDWDNQIGNFIKVMPRDFKRVLQQTKAAAAAVSPEPIVA